MTKGAPRRIPLQRQRLVPMDELQRGLENISVDTSSRANDTNSSTRANDADANTNVNANAKVSSGNIVAMDNYRGVVYSADMEINGATYRVQVDTGSSDLWLSCYYVERARCRTTCPVTSTEITYGSGKVCVFGEYGRVKLGDVEIDDYGYGVAVGLNVLPVELTGKDPILLGEAQGLLGLGYRALATIQSPVGLFIDFVDSFSVFLTAEDDAIGSFLMINGVDDALIERDGLTAYTVPLKEPSHWTLGMTGFQVGDDEMVLPCLAESATQGSCDVIVDTGTSLLIMPTQLYNAFATKYLLPKGCFTSSEVASSEVYICDRDVELPQLHFSFDNMNFYLDKKDYIIDASPSRIIVELQASSSATDLGQTWVLGDTFLKQFYSSYEVDRSVTFYCKEGTTCDHDGSASKASSISSSSMVGTGNSSRTGQKNNGTSASNIGVDETPTSVASASEGGGISVVLIVLISVLGVFITVLAVICFRRWWKDRARRNQNRQAAIEMETLSPTGAPPSRQPYVLAVAASPSASKM